MRNPITAELGFECYPGEPRKADSRVAKTIRLSCETSRKLQIAKRKLNMMSDTACIEDALRGWFRKHDIE